MTKLHFFAAKAAALTGFLLSLILFSTAPAQAQSACKGLSKSACTSNSKCSHVGAFTRSDGARVKAFCRAKPGSGSKKTAKKTTTRKKKTTATNTSASTRSTTTRSSTKTTKKKTTKKTVAAKKPVKKTKKKTAKTPVKKKKKSTAGTS